MYDNPENLRVIKTARNLKTINKAIQQGFQVVLKLAETNPPFPVTIALYKNNLTGEISLNPDPRRHHYFENSELAIPEFEVCLPMHKNPFAAYLIPTDLPIGEKVWLEDLIEDFIGTHGCDGDSRLESASAVWNGKDFEIDYIPERDIGYVIG